MCDQHGEKRQLHALRSPSARNELLKRAATAAAMRTTMTRMASMNLMRPSRKAVAMPIEVHFLCEKAGQRTERQVKHRSGYSLALAILLLAGVCTNRASATEGTPGVNQ